jgi:hypothetical protein
MAKAQLTTSKGTKIVIEGTADEVAAMVRQLEASESGGHRTDSHQSRGKSRLPVRKAKVGPVVLISELIDGGYFKKPKGLGNIKETLEEQGHFYPVTSLSPVVLRLVKKRQLRRVKEGIRWLYVE